MTTLLATVESDLTRFVHQQPAIEAAWVHLCNVATGEVKDAVRHAAESPELVAACKALVVAAVAAAGLGFEAALTGVPVVGGILAGIVKPLMAAGEAKVDALAGAEIDGEAARLACADDVGDAGMQGLAT